MARRTMVSARFKEEPKEACAAPEEQGATAEEIKQEDLACQAVKEG